MPFRPADAVFWIAVACCAIAELAILRSAIVSPTSVGASAAVDARSTPASARRRALEIAWAVVPAVALAVVLLYTWRAMHPPSVPGVGIAQ